jgi:hypothetical protein
MLEKGKGHYIEHLRIIQLVEADLNFVLHVVWGNRLPRHAIKHNALHPAQFALPGQTCQNASCSQLLFLDLMRQTFSPGLMTDYDATAAFDRVLSSLSIITCERMGLPRSAGLFMYNLLKHTEFHLVTGFGRSSISYSSNENPTERSQGVLQGSSSAAPICTMNSDVSLAAYAKLGTGAVFTHPISGDTITDIASKYADDKTQFLNLPAVSFHINNPSSIQPNFDLLRQAGNTTSETWADLLWIPGGNLNIDKCFSYSITPKYNLSY